MGACVYCGKPAGIFRSKHPECHQHHLEQQNVTRCGRDQITTAVTAAIRGGGDLDDLERAVSQIEQSAQVPAEDRHGLLVQGWEGAVDQALEDGVLSEDEEERLLVFSERFALTQGDLDTHGAYTKTAKAGALRDVLGGTIPSRFGFDTPLSINFQKGEQIVWAFPRTEFLEDKLRRQFVGGSRGVSVKVMKGVYYRVGAFKGHTVEHTERVLVDTGMLVVTQKNLYFAGPQKAVRVPYAKIISFEPFEDGIGILRDAATAKPQLFVTGDGWFTYNLVTNLAQL